jgi:Domain of Unknown Function (DUF350)
MGRVLADYVTAIGWGVVGAISMAAGLAILLKVFDWLTPINEWAEIQKGNAAFGARRRSAALFTSGRPGQPRTGQGRLPPHPETERQLWRGPSAAPDGWVAPSAAPYSSHTRGPTRLGSRNLTPAKRVGRAGSLIPGGPPNESHEAIVTPLPSGASRAHPACRS